jgi:hypothetical protein
MEHASFQDARDLTRQVSKRVTDSAESAFAGAQNMASDLLARAHDTLSPDSTVNVGDMERLASTLGGTLMIFSGLSRGSLFGGLVAVAGGALIHRGLTGHCAVYDRLGHSSAAVIGQSRKMPTLRAPELVPEGVLASAASGG